MPTATEKKQKRYVFELLQGTHFEDGKKYEKAYETEDGRVEFHDQVLIETNRDLAALFNMRSPVPNTNPNKEGRWEVDENGKRKYRDVVHPNTMKFRLVADRG